MDLHFTEASSLAVIDRQIGDSLHDISPAQYEIIRQVIYHTGDFEYSSLLKFSQGALAQGAAALMANTPIVVDVPEIQVSIVPMLQQTFSNAVYCCATTGTEMSKDKTKTAHGLEVLASNHPDSIVIIGQDRTTWSTLNELIRYKVINPSLAIATPPVFIEQKIERVLRDAGIAHIYIDRYKGDACVASAIFNSLVKLTWQAYQQ